MIIVERIVVFRGIVPTINGAVRVVGGSAKAGHAHFQRLDFSSRFLQFVSLVIKIMLKSQTIKQTWV